MFWETSQSFIFAVARLQRMKTLGAMFKKVTMVPLIIGQTLPWFTTTPVQIRPSFQMFWGASY